MIVSGTVLGHQKENGEQDQKVSYVHQVQSRVTTDAKQENKS